MTKWHITPDNQTGPCDATTQPCPFGGDHYESREKAEFAAEILVKANTGDLQLPESLDGMDDTERRVYITKFLNSYLRQRLELLQWAKLTQQSPNTGLGLTGQYLASLILGIGGGGSAGRGSDIADGTEVKTCARVDQLDRCKKCKAGVPRASAECFCGATGADIDRKQDSKWLFSVTSPSELDTITRRVPRVMLILNDNPGFDQGDFDTIRFRAFELNPAQARHHQFAVQMTDYYNEIAAPKLARGRKPAPKNFWPESYPFYLANPVQVFQCTITDANSAPKITIDQLENPSTDRTTLSSPAMPSELLRNKELQDLVDTMSDAEFARYAPTYEGEKSKFNKLPLQTRYELLPAVDEVLRERLPVRATKEGGSAKVSYSRKIS